MTRRVFVAGGFVAASAGRKGFAMAAEDGAAPAGAAPTEGPACLDYGLSFVCNPSPKNAVRFWIESRTTLIDPEAPAPVEFYQCASCKSEHTFAEKDLFQADNYDFLPILGEGRWLVFRRPARLSEKYRTIHPVEGMWGVPSLKLRQAEPLTLVDTWEKIRDATAAALPIVSQTEITNAETGLRAVIECPVKTMNVSLDLQKYQVDTGPIAYPDLSKRFEPRIDCLSLAFIAFNAPHFADFVVEQPTAVVEAGREVTRIHHYSSPFSVPAKNRLLAVGRLGDNA